MYRGPLHRQPSTHAAAWLICADGAGDAALPMPTFYLKQAGSGRKIVYRDFRDISCQHDARAAAQAFLIVPATAIINIGRADIYPRVTASRPLRLPYIALLCAHYPSPSASSVEEAADLLRPPLRHLYHRVRRRFRYASPIGHFSRSRHYRCRACAPPATARPTLPQHTSHAFAATAVSPAARPHETTKSAFTMAH